MTAKEFAAMLDGREYGMEMSRYEEKQAAVSGLVVLYGYSDNNVKLQGCIDEEVGAFDGTTIYINTAAVLHKKPDCEDCNRGDCPYFAQALEKAKTIEAVWHDEGGPCWTFETDIPHESFTIMEDGEPFCVGIVFSVEDLGAAE